MEKGLLTRKEAAEYLSMSVRSFQRKVQPHIAMVRDGRLRGVPPDELDRWIEERSRRV